MISLNLGCGQPKIKALNIHKCPIALVGAPDTVHQLGKYAVL